MRLLDLDLGRIRLLLCDLGDVDSEHAVSKLCRDALVGGILQIYATACLPLRGLLLQVVLALVLVGLPVVHGDGEPALVELDVDLILRDARKMGRHRVVVACILDVHRECVGRIHREHRREEVIDRAERPCPAESLLVVAIGNHSCHRYHSFKCSGGPSGPPRVSLIYIAG